jgi:hypothetical protein
MLQYARNVFQREEKVVLFLCDDDLEQMLNLKEAGDDATELVRQHYDALITPAKHTGLQE